MPLSPELSLLVETLKQQIAESLRVGQENRQALEVLRAYTQEQINQIRAQLTGSGDQQRYVLDQQAERYQQYVNQVYLQLQNQFNAEIEYMNQDIEELKELLKKLQNQDLTELRKQVIENQTENYRKIIAVQGAILFFLFTTGVGIIVTLILRH